MPVEMIAHASNLSAFLYVISRDRETGKMFSVSFERLRCTTFVYQFDCRFYLLVFFVDFFSHSKAACISFSFQRVNQTKGKKQLKQFPLEKLSSDNI